MVVTQQNRPNSALSSQHVELVRTTRLIPTYPLPPAEAHPMFFQKRVYQGSSGRVYPLPFHTAVSEEKQDHPWDVIELANPWLSIEVLPQLGGRIHAVRHLPSGYDIFYRQPVIKPALVGLAGPWISGGVEFNWPQHHRPTTYMPADCMPQRHDDGSVTVWLGEHDVMARMQEVRGVRLRPDSSRVELHVRIFNRTPMRQTFMWWANVAAEVHDRYQSFFPPDVHYVADHAVRAMSSFPIARNEYYGIDYRPGTDLTWYANIPVPTSYMVRRSVYEFFGGYDHAADVGFVHVADRHIAPGKKQWTWGNSAFGWAWDRELTDPREDGRYPPYIELMAGVYTDNQPDFAYIEPYETKTFSQCWWPIRGLGPVQAANRRAALRLLVDGEVIHYGAVASELLTAATLRLRCGETVIAEHALSLQPSEGRRFEHALPAGAADHDLHLSLIVDGEELLSYRPVMLTDERVPPPAKAPPSPQAVASVDQLYLIGEHLEQYRHPTRRPEPYWEEALRRDPGDSRCHLALGRRLLGRGLIDQAIRHLESARQRLTEWHPNPESGEVFYLLGLCYRRRGDRQSAEEAFGKAAWDRRYVAAARYQLAQLYAADGRTDRALAELGHVLDADPEHQAGAVLRAALLRRSERADLAMAQVEAVLAKNPLCFFAWQERGLCLASVGRLDDAAASNDAMLKAMADPSQMLMDVALDYAAAGMDEEALTALEQVKQPATPVVCYVRWWLARRLKKEAIAAAAAAQAKRTGREGLFPIRSEEEMILTEATDALGDDPHAPYLLGCLLYDRGRPEEAIAYWRRCLDRADYAGAHRNLGLALYNIRGESNLALEHFERACALAPNDARLLYELDQLCGRLGVEPKARLKRLDEQPDLVRQRDDLMLERAHLLLLLGRDAEALALLQQHRFHPWEGGEGKALASHVAARLGLGVAAVNSSRYREGLQHFEAALGSPANLGEAKHPLASQADVHAHLGWACEAMGKTEEANRWYLQAAAVERDFSEMAVQTYSPLTFFKGWALGRLGRKSAARRVFEQLLEYARRKQCEQAEIDYFATSLPNLLVFEEDLQRRHELDHRYLEAMALRGLGHRGEAEAMFHNLVKEDPSHLGARQMLRWRHLA